MLTRDVGAIGMDLDDVEGVTIRADGGADRIEITDLTASDVRAVEIALSLPGRAGDGAADTVSLVGGDANEDIDIASGGGSLITVQGLPATVDVFGVEAADALIVSGGGGNDFLRTFDVNPGAARLTLDGDAGDDFVFGGANGETFLGGDGDDGLLPGAGDDDVFGGRGDDVGILGDGNDRFIWNPGEGNDAVVGGAGTDTLDFHGSGADEAIEIRTDGASALLLRDIGAVQMELDEVERIDLRVLGGTDEVRVRDLTDTDLTEIVIDLSAPDGASDFVIIEGTEGADTVTIDRQDGAIVVGGLAATIRILGAEAGLDDLLFLGLGGDDIVDATLLQGVRLFVQGGAGDDVIFGSAGADVLLGDDGDDVILAAAGSDRVFGGPGDDVLDGGAGLDTLTRGGGVDVLLNGEVIGDTDVSDAWIF